MSHTYTARPNAPINDEQAQLVGEELDSLRDQEIPLTPQALLDRAKSPKSKIHSLFEWNDTVAAEKWRIAWARQLIGSVEVVFKTKEPQKAFYSVTLQKPETERQYFHRAEVVNVTDARDELSKELLQRLWRVLDEVESWKLHTTHSEWKELYIALTKAAHAYRGCEVT